jgi:penicillin-binding protein-related factor A (putative recombinase)
LRNPTPPLLERDIKRQIVQWLQYKQCFVWVNHSTGIFDPTQGRFRKLNGFGQIRGTADLLGIWKGKPLAIEVKTPTGRLSQYQAIFLERFAKAGGIAFVARSVEDVAKALSVI